MTRVFDQGKRARWWLHAPFGLVLAVGLVGFLGISQAHWRAGSFLLGCAFLLGAVIRALLPPEAVGLLAIRSRVVDSLLFSALGLLIVGVAMTITGGPLGR